VVAGLVCGCVHMARHTSLKEESRQAFYEESAGGPVDGEAVATGFFDVTDADADAAAASSSQKFRQRG
jgi:hypothetical protein